MEKTNVFLKNFSGTSYEVGTQIGNWILSAPDLLQKALLPPNTYPRDKYAQITAFWTGTVPVSMRRSEDFQIQSV